MLLFPAAEHPRVCLNWGAALLRNRLGQDIYLVRDLVREQTFLRLHLKKNGNRPQRKNLPGLSGYPNQQIMYPLSSHHLVGQVIIICIINLLYKVFLYFYLTKTNGSAVVNQSVKNKQLLHCLHRTLFVEFRCF